MTIRQFEDIEGWKAARMLANAVYDLTMNGAFARDYGLSDQISRAAGSAMHNIAEGFDSGSGPEFIKFLRYSQRSCAEVKSQLYLALDRDYITSVEFRRVLNLADTAHARVGGFIKYLLQQGRLPAQGPQQKTRNEKP